MRRRTCRRALSDRAGRDALRCASACQPDRSPARFSISAPGRHSGATTVRGPFLKAIPAARCTATRAIPRLAIILITLILSFAEPSWGATIRVRSGDHPDFSRLVFLISPMPDWSVDTDERRVSVWIEGEHRFVTQDVFRFITRDRIERISRTGPDSIEIGLACDCRIRSFLVDAGLVVDVMDDPAATPDRAPTGKPSSSTFNAFHGDTLAIWRVIADGRKPHAETQSRPTQSKPGDNQPGTVQTITPMVLPKASSMHATDGRRGDLLHALLQDLARGASQGLVAIATGLPTPEAGDSASSRQSAAMHNRKPSPEAGERGAPSSRTSTDRIGEPGERESSNIQVESVIDEWFGSGAEEPPVTDQGIPCLPDELLDVPSWSDELPFPDLSRHRAQLLDDRDRPVPEMVLSRARHLLFWGFGAEAIAVLEAFGAQAPSDSASLKAIARIIDGHLGDAADIFSGQHSCSGRAALWAYLSQPEMDRPHDINAQAIVNAFAELPSHLRRLLGPPLVARLTADNLPQPAFAIMSSYERAPGPVTAAMRLASALSTGENAEAEARAALMTLRRGTGEEAARALLALAKRELAAGRTAGRAMIEELSARSVEFRGTPLGDELKQQHIETLMASGRWQDAIEELIRSLDARPAPNDTLAILSAETIERTVQSTQFPRLLPLCLRLGRRIPTGPAKQRARLALATGLARHGLPDLAGRMIEGLDDESEPVRTLRTRILRAQQRAYGASMLLQHAGSPEHEPPAATTQRISRGHGNAPQEPGAPGEKGDSSPTSSLSHRQGTSALPPATGSGVTSAPTLASSRRLLSESAMLRGQVAALLSRAAKEPVDDNELVRPSR